MIEKTAIYVWTYDRVFSVYLIRKERLPVGKTKLVWDTKWKSGKIYYGKLQVDETSDKTNANNFM